VSSSKKRSGRGRHKPAIQVELPLPGPRGDLPAQQPPALPWWQQPPVVIGLAALAALLLLGTVFSQYAAYRDRARAEELQSSLHTRTLRAATRERPLRIEPNPHSWSASPDASIGWPEPPEELEIYIPVAYTNLRNFAITIDKVDHGRVMVLHRLRPDSNNDLRLSINSSALGPGEFRIRLHGYTRLGERQDVGWARLVIN